MNCNDKVRPLYILKILTQNTDEDHYLTTAQISALLKENYNEEAHRITIKKDIQLLNKLGYNIDEYRGTQNQYRFKGRQFELAEMKMIIDAIASAKFIPEAESRRLIKKISAMTSKKKADELKRNVVSDRGKMENKNIYKIVNVINDAINQKKKICFRKVEYNIRKERIFHNKGEEYTFSPYSLVWDGDNYYVVGWSDKHQGIGSHRVDRIADIPEILDEPARKQPLYFRLPEYLNATMHMNIAPVREVELLCDNSVINAVVDKFGPKVRVAKEGESSFRVYQEVAAGKVFYDWVFGFEGKVKIAGPEDVKRVYSNMLKRALGSTL